MVDRHVFTLYCDDIRNELGNKSSLMGIYAGDLFVEKFPIVLPKLCAYVVLKSSVDDPIKALSIRLMKDDEQAAIISIPPDELERVACDVKQNSRYPDISAMSINVALSMAPFFLDKECTLRTIAETENGELLGPRLKIQARQVD